ncbi:Uma2 family endonuclease [soil metagenome]
MASATLEPSSAVGESGVVLHGIGWDGYETIMKLVGDRRYPRLLYRQGNLIMMSPSRPHERPSERLGLLVMEIAAGLRIPCCPTAMTTFRRADLDQGIQGDKTFYLDNEARIRGKDEIDLMVDPPPDLVIEVEITNPAKHAVAIWSQLGVPEIWVFKGKSGSLRFLLRQADGTYAESETSASFPFLKSNEVAEWINRPETIAESEWLLQVRDWVRHTLAPRRAAGA